MAAAAENNRTVYLCSVWRREILIARLNNGQPNGVFVCPDCKMGRLLLEGST